MRRAFQAHQQTPVACLCMTHSCVNQHPHVYTKFTLFHLYTAPSRPYSESVTERRRRSVQASSSPRGGEQSRHASAVSRRAVISVDSAAVLKRINRKLAARGEKLFKTRGDQAALEVGEFFTVNESEQRITGSGLRLEPLARQLGVLMEWERLCPAIEVPALENSIVGESNDAKY